MNAFPIRAFIILCLALVAVCADATPKRPLEVNDFDRLLTVGNPVCSRDGRWVAYTVEQPDLMPTTARAAFGWWTFTALKTGV